MITHARKRGRGFLNKLINNLPVELHIPGYQYCGPGTKLSKRLARGDLGINQLDAACKEHDIAYSKSRDVTSRNVADKLLAEKAWNRVVDKTADIGEKTAAYAVNKAMKLKSKLGMGIKKRKTYAKKRKTCVKKKKLTSKKKTSLNQIIKMAAKSARSSKRARDVIKSVLKNARSAIKKSGGKKNIKIPRILPISSKVGGYLPFLIPLFAGLSATGALAGGAAGIAKAVNDAKSANQQLDESHRHNKTMEAIALGKGLYLKPYKTGLPKRALTNFDLLKYAKILKIPNFRGVFMRNNLPADGPKLQESAIVNLDDMSGPGTHWVAYRKNKKNIEYFDSFGDLQPPLELMLYFGISDVKYNVHQYQNYNTYDCGHLCLMFLNNKLKKYKS